MSIQVQDKIVSVTEKEYKLPFLERENIMMLSGYTINEIQDIIQTGLLTVNDDKGHGVEEVDHTDLQSLVNDLDELDPPKYTNTISER